MLEVTASELGWMSRYEAEAILEVICALADAKPMAIRVLEIGVWQGKTARLMLRQAAALGMRPLYVGIDSFAGGQVPDFAGLDVPHGGMVLIVPTPSTKAFNSVHYLFPRGIDLVLSDGCHCLDCVSYEWSTLGNLVVPGGYFALHDISWPEGPFSDPASAHQSGSHGCRRVWREARMAEGWKPVKEIHRSNGGIGILQRIGPLLGPESP